MARSNIKARADKSRTDTSVARRSQPAVLPGGAAAEDSRWTPVSEVFGLNQLLVAFRYDPT